MLRGTHLYNYRTSTRAMVSAVALFPVPQLRLNVYLADTFSKPLAGRQHVTTAEWHLFAWPCTE